jgi:HEPN domain-containing protein
MSPDAARIAEARSWLVKAASDLRAAIHEFTATPPLLDDIAFHTQQAVEKTLKGFLAWHDRPFRKTHDLVELGQACVDIDASLEPLLRRAAPLTEYAWRFRYPGEPEEPSPDEASGALVLAREVHETILSRMPSSVRP